MEETKNKASVQVNIMASVVFIRIIVYFCLSVVHVHSQTIPLPTRAQYDYQAREVVGLTSFNMATFFHDADPACNKNNWPQSGDPKSFNPTNLNISSWIESYKAIGAKSAVLTAKHGCGFCLWPTKVLIPSTGLPYNYSVQYSSYTQGDIVQQFVDTARAAGLGVGFYYSLTNNFYLNVYQHQVQPSNTLLPGQQNVTQAQFEQIAKEQLIELFTNYGNLTEFWFDGGTADLSQTVKELMAQYQPMTATFNGQDVSPNVVKWVGTESGMPKGPIWSTGYDATGDPNATTFAPAGCDTTLQNGDHWFYTPSAGVRSLQTLIQVYHDTVGANCGALEMDFAIDTTGGVAANQAAAYKQFGAWIDSCYGQSISATNMTGMNSSNNRLELKLNGNDVVFDRVMVQEDLMNGQRVRAFEIEVNGNQVQAGTAVGYKQIVLLKQNFTSPATVTFVLNAYVGDAVNITNLALFAPCTSE